MTCCQDHRCDGCYTCFKGTCCLADAVPAALTWDTLVVPPGLWYRSLSDLVPSRVVNPISRHFGARQPYRDVLREGQRHLVLIGQVLMLSARDLEQLRSFGRTSYARLLLTLHSAGQQAPPVVNEELEARQVAHLVHETNTGLDSVTATRHFCAGGERRCADAGCRPYQDRVGFCLTEPSARLRVLTVNCRVAGRSSDAAVYDAAARIVDRSKLGVPQLQVSHSGLFGNAV